MDGVSAKTVENGTLIPISAAIKKAAKAAFE